MDRKRVILAVFLMLLVWLAANAHLAAEADGPTPGRPDGR
jgi:hypothetical protein